MALKSIDTPIWQLSVRELLEIIDNSTLLKMPNEEIKKDAPNYVYGISGLAKLLGCSKGHASKLKAEGLFDEAIIQNGRKIIIDSDKALELFKKNK